MSSWEPEKMNPTEEKKSLILSLPDDLLLSCLARVSRLYYKTLSLVSKRFQSLLASPELYKTRSLSGCTESCLYVCFDDCRWFTLSRTSHSYVLTRLPNPPTSHRAFFSCLVTVGSDIYTIAGSESEFSRVSILDCRSHTWRLGPSVPVELGSLRLDSLTATAVGRKIYVAGTTKQYFNNKNFVVSEKFVKVLNIETETWDHVRIPSCGDLSNKSVCFDGKFHLVTKEGGSSMVAQGGMCSYCGIGNVLYCGDHGRLRWYDTGARMWRKVEGLVGLPKIATGFSSWGARLTDYGGKLAVLWQEPFPDSDCYLSVGQAKRKIWCAVIGLERRTHCEIWGEVEWFDHLLNVPSSSYWNACAATV